MGNEPVTYLCLLDDKRKTKEELHKLCIYYRTHKTTPYLNNHICKTQCKNPEAMGIADEINDILKNKPASED